MSAARYYSTIELALVLEDDVFYVVSDAGCVKVSDWCEVMSSIFSMQLPWHSLRSKLAKLNSAGLVDYRSTFDDFKLRLKHNPEVRVYIQSY